MPVTSRLGVMAAALADNNVPWKVPLRGLTLTADQVPVEGKVVQPPAAVEY
jgi:hypothetical protein